MSDINITDVEKEHLRNTIDSIYDNVIGFAKSNRNFIKWMTTSALAILGFYLTVLFQIKNKIAIPLPVVAVISFALLLICILTGIYARFRFEVKDWFGKMTEWVQSSLNLIQFIVNKNPNKELTQEDIASTNQSLEELRSKLKDAQTSLSKINLVRIMLIQVVSLSLGTCVVAFYIFYYFFIVKVPLK